MNRSIRTIISFGPSLLTAFSLQIIEKNTKVRLKIVGTRVDATEIVSHPFLDLITPSMLTSFSFKFAIGTIKEDHLGVID